MIIKKGTLLFNDNETYRFDVDTTLQEIKQTFSEDGFSERDYYDFIWGNYVGTIINIVFHKNSKHLVDEELVKLKGKEYTFEELDKTKETWENMASEVLVEEDLIKADQEIKKRLDLMKIFLDKKE